MRSSTFARTRTGRVLTLSVAAGVLALSGPTLPAAAQSTPQPPRLDESQVPSGAPLGEQGRFQHETACMQGSSNQIQEKPWGQLVLGFEEAHQELRGQGQRIAVIDTGINDHPRLRGRVNINGGSNVPDGKGAGFDCDGHGTAVAGIIAASEDPNTGFVGVAPEATLMSIRQSSSNYVDQNTDETIGDTQTMAQAVQYAVDNNATVINISQSSCQAISEAMRYGDPFNQQLHNAVRNAYEKGIVVVAAAGNAGEGCQKNAPGNPTTAVLPAWFDDYVLTVASVNSQGAPSEFTVPGPWVDVAAPGENITTLDPGVGGTGLANQVAQGGNGQLGPIQGTSFAAPYVAGVVALIKQKYGPSMSAGAIMNRLKETALHPGGDDGRNDIVGYGMINPMAALNNVVPAEHNAEPAPTGPTRLDANAIPQPDWASRLVAFGGALGGIGAVVFTAFLINAVRNVRARQAGVDKDSL